MPAITKLLIANRGEIAVRIAATAHGLGYRTVAVYSDADATAAHVRAADEAVRLGPPPPGESYLDVERLLAAARRTGADALHPGYGFLAENAELAARCAASGITFVGPPAEAIRLMGDKAEARRRMAAAGVPVIPGYDGADQSDAALVREAAGVGFPLLVKAAVGGGGRGMRVVRDPAALVAEVASARAEAAAAFGRGDVLLERLIEHARHVEIQIFCDAHGHAIHLGERDCSTQRRHQKVIEEAPSPAVDEPRRARMGAAAVAAALAAGYVGAGTVEMLLADDGRFYFIEMNTRLQVEHPVTELVTGLDLVAWQLAVAEGQELPRRQEAIRIDGHAIEARLYAEDPYAGFLPQTGTVLRFRPSTAPGVRVDAGVREGQEITPYYDPLLAKIVAFGPTREIARRRLVRALEETTILGVVTNRDLLGAILQSAEFVAGAMTTDHLDRVAERGGLQRPPPSPAALGLGALLLSRPETGPGTPWRNAGRAAWTVALEGAGPRVQVRLTHDGGAGFTAEVGAVKVALALLEVQGGEARFEADGVQRRAAFVRCGAELHLEVDGLTFSIREPPPDVPASTGRRDTGPVRAATAGRVVAVRVQPGDAVEAGQTVVVVEAMKMEHRVAVTHAGIVATVSVAVGDQVVVRQPLLTVTPAAPAVAPATD